MLSKQLAISRGPCFISQYRIIKMHTKIELEQLKEVPVLGFIHWDKCTHTHTHTHMPIYTVIKYTQHSQMHMHTSS